MGPGVCGYLYLAAGSAQPEGKDTLVKEQNTQVVGGNEQLFSENLAAYLLLSSLPTLGKLTRLSGQTPGYGSWLSH